MEYHWKPPEAQVPFTIQWSGVKVQTARIIMIKMIMIVMIIYGQMMNSF